MQRVRRLVLLFTVVSILSLSLSLSVEATSDTRIALLKRHGWTISTLLSRKSIVLKDPAVAHNPDFEFTTSEEIGLRLRQYIGTKIILYRYQLRQRYKSIDINATRTRNLPMQALIYEYNGKIIGACISIVGMEPGIIALEDMDEKITGRGKTQNR